jgi:glycogen(starch) synthase
MRQVIPQADYLIEVSHEVVYPHGGINTVLKTKLVEMKRYYGDNYLMIGPYFPQYAKVEFRAKPYDSDISRVFKELKKEGAVCHYGVWDLPGKPNVILIDYSKLKFNEELRKRIEKEYKIDCENLDPRMSHALVWADLASKLVQGLIMTRRFKDKKGVVHVQDYVPGLVLLDLWRNNANIGLVYTTHGTVLGRQIAMEGEDLYREMSKAMRRNRKVQKGREYKYGGYTVTRHQFEAAIAKHADIFTTVSDITAEESRYILGTKPDLITPNGLDMEKFPNLEERAVLHHLSKEKIYRFLSAYFLPYYPIEIKDSLLFFTSGRYERRTKGYDVLIEALHKLNERLKKEKFEKNIFVFLFIMTPLVRRPKKKVLENLSVYKTIESTVKNQMPYIEKKIISCLTHRKPINMQTLFDPIFLTELRKITLRFRRGKGETAQMRAFVGLGKTDMIIDALKENKLTNKGEDKVRVIFYPAPVSIADGLLSMEYDDVINAMHLGIFPSMYEPWGYTPHETTSHSIITVTTDAAGFGKFVQKKNERSKKPGVYVLKVVCKGRKNIVNDLCNYLYDFVKLSRQERIQRKLEARKIASLADWKEFIKYYIKAHNLAIKRCKERRKLKKR